MKGVEATGTASFRGVQSQVGELIGMSNLVWALTTALALTLPVPPPPDFVSRVLQEAQRRGVHVGRAEEQRRGVR